MSSEVHEGPPSVRCAKAVERDAGRALPIQERTSGDATHGLALHPNIALTTQATPATTARISQKIRARLV